MTLHAAISRCTLNHRHEGLSFELGSDLDTEDGCVYSTREGQGEFSIIFLHGDGSRPYHLAQLPQNNAAAR